MKVKNLFMYLLVFGLLTILPNISNADSLDNWQIRDSGTNSELWGITYGSGKYVAVGIGTILYSYDGIAWVSANSPTPDFLIDVTFAGDRFLAVGGTGDGTRYDILTSFNGVDWSIESENSIFLNGVAYGNGTYVIVGEMATGVLTSKNGIDWKRTDPVQADYREIIFAENGTFVAVGCGGIIITSTDGEDWTVSSANDNCLFGVAYGNEAFVAVSASTGAIHRSPDGINWVNVYPGSMPSKRCDIW